MKFKRERKPDPCVRDRALTVERAGERGGWPKWRRILRRNGRLDDNWRKLLAEGGEHW